MKLQGPAWHKEPVAWISYDWINHQKAEAMRGMGAASG